MINLLAPRSIYLLLFCLPFFPEEIDVEAKGTKVWGHRQLDTHFINCIINNKKPQVTVENGIITTEISKKMVKE